jgi:hypothetical protein
MVRTDNIGETLMAVVLVSKYHLFGSILRIFSSRFMFFKQKTTIKAYSARMSAKIPTRNTW